MPYIPKNDRKLYEGAILTLKHIIKTPGELNYVITRLVHNYIAEKKLCYDTLNSVVGVFTCALSEFQRRILSPYEDQKMEEHGDV